MNIKELRYREDFPEEFSIKHKITEKTEKNNFHLHKQLEIIFTLSDNIICRYEGGEIPLPVNSILLLNPMDLHYICNAPGLCDRYVIYFSPNYISRLSTPEVNLLECFYLSRRSDQPAVLLP